jgi:hypothetical protein
VPVGTLKRRLVFSAWANAVEKHPFDRLATAKALSELAPDELVLEHGEALTAVELIQNGSDDKPTRLRLLALHDAANAPSAWQPGQGASLINLGDGQYSAFITHVSLWHNNIVAHDAHANAPGLGRLAIYLNERADQKVMFRALYEQDLADQLEDLDGVRGVEFAIHSPHKTQTATGMIGSLLPRLAPKAPAIRVSFGMGRRGPRDAYLDSEIATTVHELADKAEQLFDSLKVRGKSKTIKTDAGRPKTVEINLLSHRVSVDEQLPRDDNNPSVPEQTALFKAITRARKQLQDNGTLERAVEARMLADQQS